jgi:hemerythrin-like domain-containing protein
LKEGKEIPSAILLDTVDFIMNFIDRCHRHAKEEHGLFAALEATGMPRENSAIGTMLREHEEARKIAGQIRTAVESYINNVSPGTREDLVHHCEAFMSPISTGISSRRTTAVFS